MRSGWCASRPNPARRARPTRAPPAAACRRRSPSTASPAASSISRATAPQQRTQSAGDNRATMHSSKRGRAARPLRSEAAVAYGTATQTTLRAPCSSVAGIASRAGRTRRRSPTSRNRHAEMPPRIRRRDCFVGARRDNSHVACAKLGAPRRTARCLIAFGSAVFISQCCERPGVARAETRHRSPRRPSGSRLERSRSSILFDVCHASRLLESQKRAPRGSRMRALPGGRSRRVFARCASSDLAPAGPSAGTCLARTACRPRWRCRARAQPG